MVVAPLDEASLDEPVRGAAVKAVSPAKRGRSAATRLDGGEHTRTLSASTAPAYHNILWSTASEKPAHSCARQLGIPEEVEHGIRRKWNSDSGGSGTANPGSGTRNPEEVEQRFRRKWNSGSGGRERSSVA